MSRPRSFIWQRNTFGPPSPQITFDDPRAGSLEIKPVAEIKLAPDDTRSIEELAAAYPIPGEIG